MKSRSELTFWVVATPPLLASIIGAFVLDASVVSTRGADQPAAASVPNRSRPKASPAPNAPNPLPFSASPTTLELFRARVFEEPLVPIEGEPSVAENADLAAALSGYAHRSGRDDFSSLTGYLDQHPASVWRAALLTGLGSEYYNTAHYSLALEAWKEAWALGQNATSAQGKAIADRAGGELAYMYARLGRMVELDTLLQSVAGRGFIGPGNLKIIGAREGLWTMKHRPEIAFFCGPQALGCIKAALDPQHPGTEIIKAAASTPKGCSLPYVAELSRKLGLNYQMAFREPGGAFMVPSVVHWKLGHYAALMRQVGDRYLLKDPTFRNDAWATRQALEAETSGYFLVPPGPLPKGWRAVESAEGDTVWGKGVVSVLDPGGQTPRDFHTGPPVCESMMAPTVHHGMMAPTVHLMTVNLSLVDQPVGYSPPVGPAVPFVLRYNSLDGFQPENAAYSNFGPQWSCDWISFITDDPTSGLSDVYYFIGGGQRTFTGFDTNTQSFAYQQYDETLLTRTSTDPISYTMLWPDGTQMIFSQSDGSFGTTRRVFLTQVIDPQGNAVTLAYDGLLRLVAITDAIGQVTTINHGLPSTGTGTAGPCTFTNIVADDPYKITQVTDPFGRSATFGYMPEPIGYFTCTNTPNSTNEGIFTNLIYSYLLTNITDVQGLASRVNYAPGTNVFAYSITTNGAYFVTNYTSVDSLTTPYGTSRFSLSYGNGVDRVAEITHPDGSLERVEYNDDTSGIPAADPTATLPQGMPLIDNNNLVYRNTFYWSRNACATSYGDYTKARVFHWLHASASVSSGILESTKEPLEHRVWYGYAGQSPQSVGANNLPTQIGRVLDDGSTQLFNYGYNGFGWVTNEVDPLGRSFAYIYASNGIDLQEIHMTTAGKNELLFQATYNSQHRPLTTTDAAGQTTSYTYNARGQVLTATDPKGETITCDYDTNGYLLAVDGPLTGINDTVTASYDAFGRIGTLTDASGYMLGFNYDNLDRITQITYPDATFEQITYDKLDPSVYRDRAGRLTLFDYDSLRQLTQVSDPLGRVTRIGWCRCGALKSLSDALGRTTSWQMDVQGRPIAKQFADGSQITYAYENTTSRLRQVTDEKQQFTYFSYNLDNTLSFVGYANATVPTPPVSFTYDTDYKRLTSMTDGAGTTSYFYLPITGSPSLGAGQLASQAGPLPNETITCGYDELGRRVHRAINGVDWAVTYDPAGRVQANSNALGSFSYAYDGSSSRMLFAGLPNGQTDTRAYGTVLQDLALQSITHQVGATPLSQFLYGYDLPRRQILSWSQQAGAQPPDLYTFAYDAANQLLSATVTNSGALVNSFAYGYDAAANRLTEQAGSSNYTAAFNALNQLSTTTAFAGSRTNEWDAANRLTAVNAGNQRTEFTYDGASQLVGIRQLVNGAEVSHRMFVWEGRSIAEEHDTNGVVTKRFFAQGVQLVTGTNAGLYYYTRDHLGSVREVTDTSGNVRARYTYDPFGRRSKLSGDLDADFGFAGMFWTCEAGLYLTHFRAYDPNLGRWLSRDPLRNAEWREGANLYAYVRNQPVSRKDPQGLALTTVDAWCAEHPVECAQLATVLGGAAAAGGGAVAQEVEEVAAEAEPVIAAGVECAQSAGQTLIGYASGPGAESSVALARTSLPNVPNVVQTVESIVPDLEPIAEDAEAEAYEWADAWLRAMYNYRIPYLGDYRDAAGAAATAENVAILDGLEFIRWGLGLPPVPP